tara:strand:+ start:2472 stop:2651 length:180 start_codon:yes stop_codon:yes gene_type:complete
MNKIAINSDYNFLRKKIAQPKKDLILFWCRKTKNTCSKIGNVRTDNAKKVAKNSHHLLI